MIYFCKVEYPLPRSLDCQNYAIDEDLLCVMHALLVYLDGEIAVLIFDRHTEVTLNCRLIRNLIDEISIYTGSKLTTTTGQNYSVRSSQ